MGNPSLPVMSCSWPSFVFKPGQQRDRCGQSWVTIKWSTWGNISKDILRLASAQIAPQSLLARDYQRGLYYEVCHVCEPFVPVLLLSVSCMQCLLLALHQSLVEGPGLHPFPVRYLLHLTQSNGWSRGIC